MRREEQIKKNIGGDQHESRPSLTFFKPNPNGIGSAMMMTFEPARGNDIGYATFTIASQSGAQGGYKTYDWDNAMSFDVTFDGLCRIVQVFRGECESIRDGRGLCAFRGEDTLRMDVGHSWADGTSGYLFTIRSMNTGAHRIKLDSAEALGMMLAIQHIIPIVGLGAPREWGED